jgi:hypothetical protein
MLARSRDFSLLVRERPDTAITRAYGAPLQEAAYEGSVLLVGEPGAGKSGILYELARSLSAEGADVVFLSVDSLSPIRRAEELRGELRLTHDLQDVLANWHGGAKGYLILDALDAARNFETQIVLKNAIADLQLQQTRWHIIASIREYDLRHGTDWQRLFAGYPTTGIGSAEFRAVRNVYVKRLDDNELAGLSQRYPPLQAVLAGGVPELRGLLRNIFNLHLMAELLERGADSAHLGRVNTQIQLLDEYWRYRVVKDDGLRDQREDALTRIVERMIADRATRVFRADVRGQIVGGALSDLEHEDIIRASDAGGDVLLFAHHILFDYAISRLVFLRGRAPDRLVTRLRGEPDLVLMLGPSLSLCFQDLWFLDRREQFWPLSFRIAEAPDLPVIAKLSAPVVAAAASAAADFTPLFGALALGHSDQQPAENFLGHLIGALLVACQGNREKLAGPWPEFAEPLSRFPRDGVMYSLRTLVWKLGEAFDTLSRAQQNNLGIARGRFSNSHGRGPRETDPLS